jgi:hypothetical protein
MGGLDCRRMVHTCKGTYTVLSITTVSTPHYGSPFADTVRKYVGRKPLSIEHHCVLTIPSSGERYFPPFRRLLRRVYRGIGGPTTKKCGQVQR